MPFQPNRRREPRPGQPIRAADLAQSYDSSDRFDNLVVCPPLEFVKHGTATALRLSGSVGGSQTDILQVTGTSSSGPGGLDYYPGKIDTFDGGTGTFADATDVWLVSRQGDALKTDGTGFYLSRLYGTANVSGDSRPVYVTTQYRSLIDVACSGSDVTGTLGP